MNTNSAYQDLRDSLTTFGQHSITMHRTESSDTFEKLMMKITNRDAVAATNAVLKKMVEVHKMIDADHNRSASLLSRNSARVFLTCFMVLSFKDDVFSSQGFLEEKLIEKARETLESFEHFRDEDGDAHQDHERVDEFIGKFHGFTELFKTWKSQDADKIVEVLCKAFYELEETMKVVLRSGVTEEKNAEGKEREEREEREDIKIWRVEIEGQKEKILEQIRIIGGEKGMARLEDLRDGWMDSVNVLDEKSMLEVARKAYWDKFAADLEGDVPNREMLYGLLGEVRDRLNAFTPRRDDLIAQNNAAIDVGLLRTEIENGAFEDAEFLKLVNFIIERILMFETPAENAVTKAWSAELMSKFAGKTVKYSDILPELMRGVCERLDKIEYDYKRYIEGCRRTSCDKCGASGFEAKIVSYMGMPTMPRCPECNSLLVDMVDEEGEDAGDASGETSGASKK